MDKDEWLDTDSDGIGDNTDPDKDGDGHANGADAFPLDPTEWSDIDGDGIGDNTDPDKDGDGRVNSLDLLPAICTTMQNTAGPNSGLGRKGCDSARWSGGYWSSSYCTATGSSGTRMSQNLKDYFTSCCDWNDDTCVSKVDAFPNDSTKSTDIDGDGISDNTDDDIDGDGVPNNVDTHPLNAYDWEDMDGDGLGDNTDTDIDGDGYANTADAFPEDATEWSDLDNDGIGDNTDTDKDGDGHANGADAFPTDPTEWSDLDNDGIGDNSDPDKDGDGYANTADAFPNHADRAIDTDGDGHEDWRLVDGEKAIVDQLPNDNSDRFDADGDGVGDAADTFELDPRRKGTVRAGLTPVQYSYKINIKRWYKRFLGECTDGNEHRMYAGCGNRDGPTNTYPDGTDICSASYQKRVDECATACLRAYPDYPGFIVHNEGGVGRCYCESSNCDSGVNPSYNRYDFNDLSYLSYLTPSQHIHVGQFVIVTSGTCASNGYEKVSTIHECDQAAISLNQVSPSPSAGYNAINNHGPYGATFSSCHQIGGMYAYWNTNQGTGGCESRSCICKDGKIVSRNSLSYTPQHMSAQVLESSVYSNTDKYTTNFVAHKACNYESVAVVQPIDNLVASKALSGGSADRAQQVENCKNKCTDKTTWPTAVANTVPDHELAYTHGYPTNYDKVKGVDVSGGSMVISIQSTGLTWNEMVRECAKTCYAYTGFDSMGGKTKGFLIHQASSSFVGRCYCSAKHSSEISKKSNNEYVYYNFKTLGDNNMNSEDKITGFFLHNGRGDAALEGQCVCIKQDPYENVNSGNCIPQYDTYAIKGQECEKTSQPEYEEVWEKHRGYCSGTKTTNVAFSDCEKACFDDENCDAFAYQHDSTKSCLKCSSTGRTVNKYDWITYVKRPAANQRWLGPPMCHNPQMAFGTVGWNN